MKYLIIQLSDMHCKDNRNTLKIEKAIAAVKTLGRFDGAVLVFSGDLTEEASKNEFRSGRRLLGTFLTGLSTELNCGFINTMIVPGNHDMYLPEDSRGVVEIEAWNNKDEHLSDELQRLNNFFVYANSKNCFLNDKLCDVRVIDIGDIKIQFCLLNSAPFSTRKPEDKQLHYLPSEKSDLLVRDLNVDLKITVMHHHFEWCEWHTKEMLKKAIVTDDITMFGHDHKAEAATITNGDGSVYEIIMGGKFDLDTNKPGAFNALTYDSETKSINRYEFNWSVDNQVFVPKKRGKIAKKQITLTPTNDYLDHLLSDSQHISKRFTDYYVLPKLSVEGEVFSANDITDYVDIEDIFTVLKTEQAIRITGGTGAGKSALLSFIYNESIKRGYVPLLVEQRDYRDSKIDKMFKNLFEEQYGEGSEGWYDLYLQTDCKKQIVFIDDIDLISNSKARHNLVTDILNSGKLLIYTTKEKNQDLEEIVKEKLQGKEISTINILPVYKETRDELVTQIGTLFERKSDEIDAVKMALDYMVQCQTSFFSFTPGNMLQYVKYFFNSGVQEHKNIQTISMVFETNIRNSLLQHERDAVAGLYLTALEYIADEMYFVLKTEKISISQFENIVLEYNEKRRANIKAKELLESCLSANIFKEERESFNISFYDHNTYAYFIARALNREFEKSSTETEKITFVMNHICFGINDSIILFLSFIRSNTNVILHLADKAIELMEEYPEWDFDSENIPFLHCMDSLPGGAPSVQEKKEVKKQAEATEKRRHQMIRFRGIFDYDENDINKTRYRIMRALKYARIIGRAFIDQFGALDCDEIEKISEALFSVPQKVVYASLKPYQDNFEKIVNSIIEFVKEEIPDENIKADDVVKMLGKAGTMMALNILNDVAYNASNANTITVLRDSKPTSSNQKILQLMMEENVGNTGEFIARAISLRKDLEGSVFARMLIAQIARKHIIYTANIDHRQINQLISGNVISQGSKPVLLLEKGEKASD